MCIKRPQGVFGHRVEVRIPGRPRQRLPNCFREWRRRNHRIPGIGIAFRLRYCRLGLRLVSHVVNTTHTPEYGALSYQPTMNPIHL